MRTRPNSKGTRFLQGALALLSAASLVAFAVLALGTNVSLNPGALSPQGPGRNEGSIEISGPGPEGSAGSRPVPPSGESPPPASGEPASTTPETVVADLGDIDPEPSGGGAPTGEDPLRAPRTGPNPGDLPTARRVERPRLRPPSSMGFWDAAARLAELTPDGWADLSSYGRSGKVGPSARGHRPKDKGPVKLPPGLRRHGHDGKPSQDRKPGKGPQRGPGFKPPDLRPDQHSRGPKPDKPKSTDDRERQKFKPEKVKPLKSKPETSKPERSKPEKLKPEKAKPEKSKPETQKPETSKPEKSKPEKSKPEKSKPEKAKSEKPEPDKGRKP